MDPSTLLAYLLTFCVLIFSIILHEVAHGYVAYRLGDWTAKLDGRLTLNPIPHIDPLGTIILPLAFMLLHSPVAFGWAKPVPVNYHNLKGGERDFFWVSIAGIVVNLLLALIGGALFRIIGNFNFPYSQWVDLILYSVVSYNLLLALFNLVPIPPLDGSRLIRTILPRDYQNVMDQIEPFGFFILFFFLMTFQGQLSATVSQLTSLITGI